MREGVGTTTIGRIQKLGKLLRRRWNRNKFFSPTVPVRQAIGKQKNAGQEREKQTFASAFEFSKPEKSRNRFAKVAESFRRRPDIFPTLRDTLVLTEDGRCVEVGKCVLANYFLDWFCFWLFWEESAVNPCR